jgi:hypothetical protein
MPTPTPQAVLEEIAAHKRGDDLARLVHTAAFAAADERRGSLADGVGELAERAGIGKDDADFPSGNALKALERGAAEAAGSPARLLLAGLLARGVALSPPAGDGAEARVVEALLWLATNTSVDAFPVLDAALGDKASGVWKSLAVLVRSIDAGSAPVLGRPSAILGAAALREGGSEVARAEAQSLAAEVRDPVLKALLASAPSPGDTSGAAVVAGQITDPPRHPAMLILLGLTGILLATHVARLVGRVALRYRRPAELFVTGKGVTLKTRTELLGRVLREREAVLPIESLTVAAREVRYPRILLYTGLFALALGSYFGISLIIDGARVGSPEMLGIGALILAGGIGLDFLLENAQSGLKGKCRVVFLQRKGPGLAVAECDQGAADAALLRLKR